MRVFKNKWFDRFCKKQRISDEMLKNLVQDIESNKIDVDYGGGVIKQRLARKGQGKSGGYRCIVLYRLEDCLFFVYSFPKNERDNITNDELIGFKEMALEIFRFSDADLEVLIETKAIIEVPYDSAK